MWGALARAIVVLVVAASIGSCNSGDDGGQSAGKPLEIGATAELENGSKLTLHSLSRDVGADYSVSPEGEYVAADVEMCAGTDGGSINPLDFGVKMSDNTYQGSTLSIKEPDIHGTFLAPSDCIRGWVTFDVPRSPEPTEIRFSSSSGDAAWKFAG